jgi:hypothetical protein
MEIRDYSLQAGWYPRDSREIERFLSDFTAQKSQFSAVISPHAGWFYSGRIAALAVSRLDRNAKTVAVLGGHLPAGTPLLFALEDAVRTPLGPMQIDTELRSFLMGKLGGKEDIYRDNTIEVLLPMLRFFFPNAKILWLRLPAEISSFNTGKYIAQAAEKLNRKINVLASTDLTHYGLNYGFNTQGNGEKALKWVKEVNDHNFIRAIEEGKPEEALKRAEQDKSACSAGAVLGAMGFSQSPGSWQLLEYGTSADIGLKEGEGIPDSFVGYAAMAFA